MTEDKKPIDRRRFTRIPQKVHLTVTPLDQEHDKKQKIHALSRDISEQGICLLSATRYKVGSRVRLVIDLEGWQLFLRTVLKRQGDNNIEPLTAIGRIAWSQRLPGSEEIQTGVQFLEIDPEDLKAFRQYLHIISESLREEG